MFFNIVDYETRTFDRTRFLNLDYGQHLVRFLGVPELVYTHFIRGSNVTVKCLGDDCPICVNNKKIISERPDDFRSATNYFPKSPRHYINVLDRTPVKVCPKCQEENKQDLAKKFSAVCHSCETFITDVEPISSNKVKVLNLSNTSAELVNSFNTSILDESGNPLGVHNFDVLFMVTKAGNKKTVTPIPVGENRDKVEVPEDALYDLSKVVITLTSDEVVNVLKGISLRDIFLARRGEQEEKLVGDAKVLNEEVQLKIKQLFGE